MTPLPLLSIENYPGIQGGLGKGRFQIQKGRTAFVDGPSGSGKTRLFRRIVDLDPQPIGDILFEGQNVRTYPLPDLRRKILFVPQDPPRLLGTAQEVLDRLSDESREEVKKGEKDSLIIQFELEEVLHRPSTQLSGGEWKRLILVAALSKRPMALLLDEPFAGLDSGRIEKVATAIQDLAAEGVAILWTSHQRTEGPLYPDQTLEITK